MPALISPVRGGSRGSRGSRPRLLLVLGVAQITLGSSIVAVNFAALSITDSTRIRHSCPFWAGFAVLLAGLIGVISWKRPLSLVVTFFTLLSVVCVILSVAGAALSCQNGRSVRDLHSCQMIGLQREGVCTCCDRETHRLRPRLCGALGELLKLHHFTNCTAVRMALKDLLFSVCGLSVVSTVICTLSTIVCCVQMFAVDMLHVLVTPRSRPLHSDCPSPQGQLLRDPEEFVAPDPPPPYYPPEYTCSSETDAQSITYNGSMDSPAPLYPSDFPPPYDAVVRHDPNSQATDVDHQLTEISNSSFCEQILSTAFSGEGSLDSGSLMMSEIIDVPDDSSLSEGSFPQDGGPGYPCSTRGCPPPPPSSSSSTRGCPPPTPGWQRPPEEERGGRAPGAVTPAPRRHSQLAAPSPRTTRPPSESSDPQLPRSSSDPGICTPTTDTDESRANRRSKTPEDLASQTSTDTAPCSEACLLTAPRLGTPELLRRLVGSRRRSVSVKVGRARGLAEAGARSMGDLKVCRGPRLLVSRFLNRAPPRCPTPTAARTGKRERTGSGPEQFSGSVGAVGGRQGVRGWDSLHLRSCGDISLRVGCQRGLASSTTLGSARPHSLIGVFQESVL